MTNDRRKNRPLTEKQRNALLFMVAFARKNGYQASAIELGEALGIAHSTAQSRITALIKKGYIEHKKGVSRGYKIVKLPEGEGNE